MILPIQRPSATGSTSGQRGAAEWTVTDLDLTISRTSTADPGAMTHNGIKLT